MTQKKHPRRGVLYAAALVAALLVLAALIPLITAVGADVEQRREDAVTSAVYRAAAQCYAVEGVYPTELSYLETTYGLMINHDRYIVSFTCYASNRPPEIQVLQR